MIRNLLIVLGFLGCFTLAGLGLYRYLHNKGETPFLKAGPAELNGTWQSKATRLQVEVQGDNLKVDKADFLKDGKAARWSEKSPKADVPRVIEWDGHNLTLTSTDHAQRTSEVLSKTQ